MTFSQQSHDELIAGIKADVERNIRFRHSAPQIWEALVRAEKFVALSGLPNTGGLLECLRSAIAIVRPGDDDRGPKRNNASSEDGK